MGFYRTQYSALVGLIDMKTTFCKVYGQFYVIPFIGITHTRKLNGDLELIIGWGKWELIIGL